MLSTSGVAGCEQHYKCLVNANGGLSRVLVQVKLEEIET